MRYLITGGEGFIGRNIGNYLKKLGHEAITMDIVGSPNIRCNILDYNALVKYTKNFDGIFHLAAVTSPPEFESDLMRGFDTNVLGTLNLLRASVENGVERVVQASSSAVYGDISVPCNEDMAISGHKNMYSTTKLFDEYLGKFFSLRNELDVISLRYFNTYGIGENSKGMYSSVITKFLDSISKRETPVIFGDGTQSRDFIYVTDVAEASFVAMERGNPGESYNIGTGISTSFNEVVTIISEILGNAVLAKYQENPFKNYQYFTQSNTSKAEQQLKWKPSFDLRNGIKEMAKSFGLI